MMWTMEKTNRYESKMLDVLKRGPFTGTLDELARELGCSRAWANHVQTMLRRAGVVAYENSRPRRSTWKIAK